MDIREFLEARLAEDEAWARAASAPYEYAAGGATAPPDGARWTWAVGEHWTPVVVDPALDQLVGGETNYGCSVTLRTVEEWPDTRGHPMPAYAATDIVEMKSTWAGHIVRHDPARVLRDVQAKRQILAAYDWALTHQHEGEETGYWVAKGGRSTLLDTLYVLAGSWSDHPDYDPAWSPGNVTGVS